MPKQVKKRKGYAVITGASSGIGAEFARQLAAEGFSLILTARRTDRLEQLARQLIFQYDIKEVSTLTIDLSTEEGVHKLMDEIEFKPVTIFINNAGFGDAGAFAETSLDKDLGIIDVNVKAMHMLTKLVIRKMNRQGGGYLLNTASSAGLMPAGPYMATYYASKAYAVSLTRAAAAELKEQGSPVHISCLCPGPVNTEFNDAANVSFALPGITPEECVRDAIRGMKNQKTVIVSPKWMNLVCTASRFAPADPVIKMTGHQQKRKLG